MKNNSKPDAQKHYEQLSLKDLLEARDLYHVYLMQHANVVATAIGRYRIRKGDSWPDQRGPGKAHRKSERTLANSEVRPYSWPAVLVFVKQWAAASEFHHGGAYEPGQMVPPTLFLPDGRRVPVCVISAPPVAKTAVTAPSVRYPLNNIGGGYAVLANVQRQERVATIACLVTDGHKFYALTNRHVAGEPGEVLYSLLGGKRERIGVSAAKQLTRVPFTELYPGLAGEDVFVNLDIGLIEVDDLRRWTAQIRGLGTMGSMVDLSARNISLSLVGSNVCGYGATSQVMLGQVHALFYRYKHQGGFDYVSDFLIGPRSVPAGRNRAARSTRSPSFLTHPGDSGTLWLMETLPAEQGKPGERDVELPKPELQPLAVQWGAQFLDSPGPGQPQAFALATCLSTVCNRLNVDPVRDWNLDQPETWGAVGHFSIASRVARALSSRVPKLKTLMTNHLEVISHDDATILTNEFKNLGGDAVVPLADVPDFYWKHGRQGFSRGNEGPNHFADMDQKRPADGVDLLSLCQTRANIDPAVWDAFYSSVRDLLDGTVITQSHRGLLPFRVWQIFDEMVQFALDRKTDKFVCAAGILTHYLGDACQPLHISCLHDGDPEQATTRTVHHQNGTASVVKEALGIGVHAAYEDDMVNANRQKILDGLDATLKVKRTELVANGFEAAVQTVALMRRTITRLQPAKIVQAFVQCDQSNLSGRARSDFFWNKFGTQTLRRMKDGTHLLAVLWESAWTNGNGNANLNSNLHLSGTDAMAICQDRDFLKSCTINQIGARLRHP